MLAAILALQLSAAGPSESDDEEAARTFAELIDGAANRGEFESALRLIDEAERLYPHHRWRFFRAAILSETGDCERAIPEYEAYLAEETLPANVQSAEAGLQACREETAEPEPEAAEPDDDVPPPTPTVVDEPPSAPEKRTPWARDPAAIALVTTGVVVVAVGAVLLIQGDRRRDAAEGSAMLSEFESELDRAQSIHAAGIAVTAAGAALAVGGAIRFAVVGTRARSRRVSSLYPLVVAF
jgi:hypothetical protein